ncbi:hypothetical protein BpHYR1_045201 [Brachionus plicatilis]|uniref:Uncharacterized protein n=1 Tax=Brachionus plicatilis TaxID=10195 RepID=A0A3M7R7V7_BRAPC|nr:hypothetical protein BpHYR1_045201 [Brachionus plicatilis]
MGSIIPLRNRIKIYKKIISIEFFYPGNYLYKTIYDLDYFSNGQLKFEIKIKRSKEKINLFKS